MFGISQTIQIEPIRNTLEQYQNENNDKLNGRI